MPYFHRLHRMPHTHRGAFRQKQKKMGGTPIFPRLFAHEVRSWKYCTTRKLAYLLILYVFGPICNDSDRAAGSIPPRRPQLPELSATLLAGPAPAASPTPSLVPGQCLGTTRWRVITPGGATAAATLLAKAGFLAEIT